MPLPLAVIVTGYVPSGVFEAAVIVYVMFTRLLAAVAPVTPQLAPLGRPLIDTDI
jgi:hypothetical protein